MIFPENLNKIVFFLLRTDALLSFPMFENEQHENEKKETFLVVGGRRGSGGGAGTGGTGTRGKGR